MTKLLYSRCADTYGNKLHRGGHLWAHGVYPGYSPEQLTVSFNLSLSSTRKVSRHQILPLFTKGCLLWAFPVPSPSLPSHRLLSDTLPSPLRLQRRLETSSASLFLTLLAAAPSLAIWAEDPSRTWVFTELIFFIFRLPSGLLKFPFRLLRSWSHYGFKQMFAKHNLWSRDQQMETSFLFSQWKWTWHTAQFNSADICGESSMCQILF